MSELKRKQLGLQVKIILDEQGEDFQADFRQWLRDNWEIYLTFHANADSMQQHREHYSARTITNSEFFQERERV